MSTNGTVDAIWIKRMKLGPMDAVDSATLVADTGIVGCSNQKGKRQVTIIEREVFDEIRRTLPDAEPHMRRANFMVSGIRLENTRRHILTLGGVRIEIWGETRPCERMDAQCHGLTAALDPHWRGGAYGVVLDDGEVRVGDAVSIQAPAQ
ncbi:MAG TPA: MOSC domain-containing protein [Longimicrobiales bacterium]|nr:MOSC domain-containing protein [Longimicrobiales bacterium]